MKKLKMVSWTSSSRKTDILNEIFLDIEKVREEARQKENRYLEIISQYEEQLKKYKEELHIYQRREEANQKTSKAEEARKGMG